MKPSSTISSASAGNSAPEISASRWIRDTLRDAAAAWSLSERAVVCLLVIPVVWAVIGAGSALAGKEAYKWFTGEDGFAETLQVLGYGTALLMGILVMRRYAERGERLIAVLYAGLVCGLFFLVGEELSWGQRFFGWQTPEALADVNKQAETNLHNIYGVGSTFKWIQMLVGAYGTFMPLVALLPSLRSRFSTLLDAVVPHYSLILYFLPMFLWRGYRNLFEPPQSLYFVVAEYNEVVELILATGFFFFLLFQLRHSRKPGKTSA